MKRATSWSLIIVLLLSFFQGLSFAQRPVIIAKIDAEIDPGMAAYVRRVVEDARQRNAAALIFEINTFGGRVDAATQIKDAILNSDVKTYAFVNKRAVSAGSLIALSCRKVIMAPGSLIGATTVVDEAGKKQSEKYQAYMRSEMRSTAERNGKRKDIAEGMVDESVRIDSLNPQGNKLVSLTYAEAKQYGICDTVLSDIEEVLSLAGLQNSQCIYTEINWAEKFVGFLNQPFVSSLLILIGLIGIFTEFKSPGLGVPVIMGIIAFALFFGSSYLLQLASLWEIILFILGLALLALEIFVVPGVGILGVAGILLMIGSIFFSMFSSGPDMTISMQRAIVQLSFTLLAAIAIFAMLFRFLPKSDHFRKLTLEASNASGAGFVSSTNYAGLAGSAGESVTPLRPAGVVMINGQKYDVITDGDFIPKGERITVAQVEGSKIIVKRLA